MNPNNNDYIPQFEEDNEKMRSKNRISPTLVIVITIAVLAWMLLCLVLNTMGIMSAFVMRICIYPLLGITIIAYIIIKHKNSTIR